MKTEYLQIFYSHFGNPLDCLNIGLKSLPPLGKDEVLVRLIAAPVNPSDLGSIQGTYGRLPTLPAVPGREGVGEIVAVGPNVDTSFLKKRVRMPTDAGSWQDFVITSSQDLVFIPEGIPDNMAAMAFINPPTAWCLLHHFVKLSPGDFIIQNAANSAVGICVIQLANYLGIKTINIVRDPYWIDVLKAMGADYVLLDNPDQPFYQKPQYPAPPKLAFNSVGGNSALNLIKSLSPNGVHVTFGGMVANPIRFPTKELVFNNITIKGFWLDHWVRTSPPGEVANLYNTILNLLELDVFNIPVEKTFPLNQYKEAIQKAQTYKRKGKILFTHSSSL